MPPPLTPLAFFAADAAVLGALLVANRGLRGRARLAARYLGVTLLVGLFFAGLSSLRDRAMALHLAQAAIAIAAAGILVHEQGCADRRRPISERWKRFVAATLALAAIAAYWEGFRPHHVRYYHRWEQYHYYMGAKYFREIGYDNLYRCTVIAEDELGVVRFSDETDIGDGSRHVDMAAEVRSPEKRIRDLGGDNLLHPVTDVLARPEACKGRFSPERWEEYKRDVRFFRVACDPKYWDDMQHDKGYNPPPGWTLGGWVFASMAPAGRVLALPVVGKVLWVQVLAMLDLVYLAGTALALYWAFGLRVTAVAVVFFGTQAFAPVPWTQGAFLRQDWLFWMVLSACATRRRRFPLAGGALVYASLLRVFPALTAVGWLVLAGHHLVRRRTLPTSMRRMLAGAAIAAAVLVPASLAVAGVGSYRQFFEHTLTLHDETPGTNRMGLRMILSQDSPIEIGPLGRGRGSGRMKYARDKELEDPFAEWMDARNARWARSKPVAWAIAALSLLGFAFVARRIRSLWIAQCLSHLFIVLGAQLACYYYASMVLLAPLTRARRKLEVPLLALAAVSQGVAVVFRFADDKHWVFSVLCLAFCVGAVGMFVRRGDVPWASKE